jgi:putative SOS response-associated peptidase YedK
MLGRCRTEFRVQSSGFKIVNSSCCTSFHPGHMTMCGRFALYNKAEAIENHFRIRLPAIFSPRYNIAPSQQVLTISVADAGGPGHPVYRRWGLIPNWAKDMKIGYKMINARAESVADKPAFRAAFKRRRCLIPASGFYEWGRAETGKQPYFVRLGNGDVLAFAGLWESWIGTGDGRSVESCTIITTDANRPVGEIHNRMPAIIAPEMYDLWLAPESGRDRLLSLLRSFPDRKTVISPVGAAVNNPRNDSPACIDTVKE